MTNVHYKLPLDDEIDKDIIDWIDSLPRMKKGEMIRHAIRYYMAELEEGETIKFPNAPVKMIERTKEKEAPSEPEIKPKRKPSFNRGAITGRD